MNWKIAGRILTTVALGFSTVHCSKGGSSSSDGGSSTGTNIYGKVTSDVSSLTSKPTRSLYGKSVAKQSSPLSGCTIKAYDIQTNELLATGSTGSDGTYTLTGSGLEAGKKYKVVATCGSTKLSSIVGADDTKPANKNPEVTDPLTTLIAAKIIQAVVEALSDAVASIADASVRDAVKKAIMKNLDSIVTSITVVIEEAVASGAMEAPDSSEASSVAGDLESVNQDTSDFTSVLDGYTDNKDIPVAIDQAVTGAANSGSSLVACSKSLNSAATADGCAQSIAKLMFNNLGFGILLKTAGGHFGATACNDGGYGAIFTNASLTTSGVPAGYCGITPKLGRVNRNGGDYGKDDGGPQFAETGDLDGVAGNETGVITALATALIAGSKYNTVSLDKIVFSSDAMNMRLIAEYAPTDSSGRSSFKYLSASNVWTAFPSTCGSGSTPCSLRDLDLDFAGAAWTSAQNNIPIATAIGAGNFLDKNFFLKKYGGSVPTQSELDDWIDKGRTHLDHNPTGEKEFQVVYTEPAAPGTNGSNPCYDRDPATACLGQSGSQSPALRVNLTYGSSSNGVKPIGSLAKSASGSLLVVPMYGQSGFSGVFAFRRVDDGRTLLDDYLRMRGVKVILNAASECGTNGLPAAGAGCADGKLYNADVTWDCSGSSCSPAYTATSSTAISQTGFNLANQIRQEYKTNYLDLGSYGHPMAAVGNWNSLQLLKLTMTNGQVAGSNLADAAVTVGTGQASAAGEYNLAVRWNCSGGTCTFAGFYLVGSDGAPHVDTDFNANGTVSVCDPSSSNCSSTINATLYTAANVQAAGGGSLDFDTSSSATTFAQAAGNTYIDNGPFPNPNFKCSSEPYFVDGNGNGALDCNGDDTAAAGGDRSFSGSWEHSDWLQAWDVSPASQAATQSARAALPLRVRENGYLFEDPVGVKKLLSTAFNGWFDGQHKIESSTSLDALQTFALLFIYFSEGEGGGSVDGFSPTPGNVVRLRPESPIFGDNSGGPGPMNASISYGFANFKTQ